jgi:hypothetical protein
MGLNSDGQPLTATATPYPAYGDAGPIGGQPAPAPAYGDAGPIATPDFSKKDPAAAPATSGGSYADQQYIQMMASMGLNSDGQPLSGAGATPAAPPPPNPNDVARARMQASGQAIPSQTFSHAPMQALPTMRGPTPPPVGSARWRLAQMRSGAMPHDAIAQPQGVPTAPPPAYQTSMWQQGQNHFADGGPVPMGASPSMGQQTDDIPAQLNAGEFVIPKDAVAWYGEKYMHGLIEKAQKDRQTTEQRTGAVPDFKQAVPTGAPVFRPGGPPPMQQRPMGRGAIPMGVA